MTESRDEGPRRVLVVDDSEDTARMMRLLLKREGFAVTIARDGHEALQSALEHRPEIVLLDLRLPGMSGLEVAEAIRRAPDLASTRLIAVSGYGRDRLPEPSPFDDYLTKPLDHNQLIGLLAERSTGPTTRPPDNRSS
jgi:CheY-like chemotaxis protein